MQKGLEVLNCFALRGLEGVSLLDDGPALLEGTHPRPAKKGEMGCVYGGRAEAGGEVVWREFCLGGVQTQYYFAFKARLLLPC
jgi:hypothetical protein